MSVHRGGVPAPNFGGGCLLQIFLGGEEVSNFWNTVNVRPVRILLECILVSKYFSTNCITMIEIGPRGKGGPAWIRQLKLSLKGGKIKTILMKKYNHLLIKSVLSILSRPLHKLNGQKYNIIIYQFFSL